MSKNDPMDFTREVEKLRRKQDAKTVVTVTIADPTDESDKVLEGQMFIGIMLTDEDEGVAVQQVQIGAQSIKTGITSSKILRDLAEDIHKDVASKAADSVVSMGGIGDIKDLIDKIFKGQGHNCDDCDTYDECDLPIKKERADE